MSGGWTEPRGREPGQSGRWLVCITMVLLFAGSISGPVAELKPPLFFEGLEEVREEVSRILPETVTAASRLWWWGGTLVPLLLHRFLGQLSQGLWELLGAPFGALIEDALIALHGSGETQSVAMGRLASTVVGLILGFLLLPLAVRRLEKGLRVVTALLPHTLQRFIAKRVARFVGKALAYVTLSLTAVGALG